MFGIHHIKANPTQFIIHHVKGNVKRSGRGLSFFYFKPQSTISVVPVGSIDVPFIFNEISSDFQPLTIQGNLTFRITQPELVASILDYTISTSIDFYSSDDPEKLPQRLVNLAQVHTRSESQSRELRHAIQHSAEIATAVTQSLEKSKALEALGAQIISFVILSIKPTPDIARAMEAEAREVLLKEADDAIYERRNSAVDQERRIKENELQTELAVQEKQRQMKRTAMEGNIFLENERKKLIDAKTDNIRVEADAQSYAFKSSLEPLQAMKPEVLKLLSMQSADPSKLTAAAIQSLAENAEKIGHLNLTPGVLEMLLNEQK
ncbi:MAG: hypothetical protein JEZ06_03890 [Anaerolineaceae bacterium]|nr:hypothetical protein [Anaerolineaceae bacterium]